MALADDTTLGGQLATWQGVLLDLGGSAPLRAVARRWDGRIRYAAADAGQRHGLRALLVRPDGVVAWAQDRAGEIAGFPEAASQWFGTPDDPTGADFPF